mgnify:CR=1 FL=1
MARYAEYEPLYEIYDQFKQNCLLNDKSFFFPDRTIWTADNVRSVADRLVYNPDVSKASFDEKLALQMQDASPEEWVIVAEAMLIYFLPPKGRKLIKEIVLGYLQKGYSNIPQLPTDYFWKSINGFCKVGIWYNQKHRQLSLILLFAEAIKQAHNRQAVLSDPKLMRAFLDSKLNEMKPTDRAYDMRNALLYLAFPDVQQPILSDSHRRSIIQVFSNRFGITDSDDDVAIYKISQQLGADKDIKHLYREDIRVQWDGKHQEPLIKQDYEMPTQHQMVRPVSQDLEVISALQKLDITKNLIFTGSPGTGKTYTAMRVARAITDEKQDCIFTISFHPSYAYEDFVEGIRPVIDEKGNLSYQVQHGVLRRVCALASKNPQKPYVLLIDEINRANLSKVFGELITLIEDDKRYGAPNMLHVKLPYSGDAFNIPANLYILGTMNTTDRSIALMDMAMRRRFAFIEISPNADLLPKITDSGGIELDLSLVLKVINKQICLTIGRAYEIGHSYFLKLNYVSQDRQLSLLEYIWNNQILPLLEEYYYNRPDELKEILKEFDTGEDVERFGFAEAEDLITALKELSARGV